MTSRPFARTKAQTKALALAALISLFIAGCAAFSSYGGGALQPGTSTRDEVLAQLGAPAQVLREEDGGELLAFPRGPMGVHTWMARIGADGRLQELDNVLDPAHFAQIQPGLSQDQVLRILGPSQPQWTVYFKARDELVWEWRYCDDFGEPARFDVLFDGTSGKVRSTIAAPERMSAGGRGGRRDWCGR
jgi:hypothetical protein